ncbi:MAG: hypothetical protein JTJ17_13900 [Streptococcus gordonii]|nr:hypothetical protein [Streptococcus gordonii]
MQKEIKASVTSSLIWVILGSLGLLFLLLNLPSALQKNDTIGLVFSGIFGIILLGIVIAFGHLAIKAPQKIREKYQSIYERYPELADQHQLIQEKAHVKDDFNSLYLYRDALFLVKKRLIMPVYLDEIESITLKIEWVHAGNVKTKNFFLYTKNGKEQQKIGLGIIDPNKYQHLMAFFEKVLELKPDLVFQNEVESK